MHARYCAGIIGWAKMYSDELMSDDMKAAVTDPQNILRFVKENAQAGVTRFR